MEGTTLNLAAVGFVVSLPVVVYGIADLARIPAHLYQFTPYSRRVWVLMILAGYACFGVGGIFMTLVWLRSEERMDLRDDLALDSRWERPVLSRAPVPSPNHPAVESANGAVTRAMRRRERQRRHRWATVAVLLPTAVALAATAIRVR